MPLFQVQSMAMELLIKLLVIYGYMPAEPGQMLEQSKDLRDLPAPPEQMAQLVSLAQQVTRVPQVLLDLMEQPDQLVLTALLD
jgi:hypothetical protein